MAYSSASDVAAYCSNLLTGASNFSTTSVPTLTAVNNWLSSGCAILEGRLKAKGFVPPTDATIAVYWELVQLNTFYGVAQAEKSRSNVRLSPGERTRSQLFEKDFWDGVDRLFAQDLARAGLTHVNAGYVGGRSVADKQTQAADTDRVTPRIFRREFANRGRTGGLPGVSLDPGGEASADAPADGTGGVTN